MRDVHVHVDVYFWFLGIFNVLDAIHTWNISSSHAFSTLATLACLEEQTIIPKILSGLFLLLLGSFYNWIFWYLHDSGG